MKKIAVFYAFLVACVILSSGCNESLNQSTNGPIKIGAVIPLSGEVATYGQSLKNGFEIAVAEDSGRYQIIYEDSKADKNTGINSINKLISSDGVKFVFGDATSGVTLAIAPIAEKNKVILFDAIATSDDIIKSGDYVFRNAPSNNKQATIAAYFMVKTLNIKEIGIVYNQTDYGVNLSEKFKQELSAHNISPMIEAAYQDGTTDFKTILTKLKGSNAKGVFVPGNYEETAALLKQAKQMDIKIPFVGTDGAYSPELLKIAAGATDNFYLTMMGIDPQNELYVKFVDSYKRKYGSNPDVFSAYGYEAAKILFESISKAGNDSEKVKAYLYGTEFSSLTGQLRFDSDGEVNRDFIIMKISEGRFVNNDLLP